MQWYAHAHGLYAGYHRMKSTQNQFTYVPCVKLGVFEHYSHDRRHYFYERDKCVCVANIVCNVFCLCFVFLSGHFTRRLLMCLNLILNTLIALYIGVIMTIQIMRALPPIFCKVVRNVAAIMMSWNFLKLANSKIFKERAQSTFNKRLSTDYSGVNHNV